MAWGEGTTAHLVMGMCLFALLPQPPTTCAPLPPPLTHLRAPCTPPGAPGPGPKPKPKPLDAYARTPKPPGPTRHPPTCGRRIHDQARQAVARRGPRLPRCQRVASRSHGPRQLAGRDVQAAVGLCGACGWMGPRWGRGGAGVSAGGKAKGKEVGAWYTGGRGGGGAYMGGVYNPTTQALKQPAPPPEST